MGICTEHDQAHRRYNAQQCSYASHPLKGVLTQNSEGEITCETDLSGLAHTVYKILTANKAKNIFKINFKVYATQLRVKRGTL